MGQTSSRFLLDSGAAVSVVRYNSLDEHWRQRIKTCVIPNTVAADGLPLEVVGKVEIPVALGISEQIRTLLWLRTYPWSVFLVPIFL